MSRQKHESQSTGSSIVEGVNSFFHGGVAGGDDSGLGRGIWSAAVKAELGGDTDFGEYLSDKIEENSNFLIGLGVVMGLRFLGMIVSITADLINLKRTQANEAENNKKYADLLAERKKLIARLIQALQDEMVVIVDKDQTIKDLQEADTIADETQLWVTLNIAFTKLILAQYRNNLTSYNLHKLQATISDITQRDSMVTVSLQTLALQYQKKGSKEDREICERELISRTQQALLKPVNLSIEHEQNNLNSPHRKAAQAFEGLGDFFISFSAGVSLTSGLLGLISMIPGINLIALGVWISALLVGVGFGVSKLIKNYYFDRKHTKRVNDYTNTTVRANQVIKLDALLKHAQDYNVNAAENSMDLLPEDLGYNPENNAVAKAATNKRELGIIVATKVVGATLLGVLLGWSLAMTFNDVVSNLALAVTGTVTSLAGNALIVVPVVGAVLTTGMYVAKTVWSLYKSYQEEKALVGKVNQQRSDLETRARRDPTLRQVIAKSKAQLLREYIEKYEANRELKTTIDSVETNEEFLAAIEKTIGFSRAEAKTHADFYGYLAHALQDQNTPATDAIAIATRIRTIANDPATITLESRRIKKPELKSGGFLQFTRLNAADRAQLKALTQGFKPGNTAEENTLIMQQIELKIGFNRAEAKTPEHFYGFLAYQLLDGKTTQAAEARSLAGHIKNIMDPTPAAPIQIVSEKATKTWGQRVFQRNDHRGNLSRLATEFKEKAAFGFASTCSVGLGIGVAATFVAVSGPGFPIALGVLVAVCLTVFIVSKVVEYRRNKRMKEHNENLATLNLQDKTAEYTKRLTDPLILAKAAQLTEQAQAEPAARGAMEPQPTRARRHASEPSLDRKAAQLAEQAPAEAAAGDAMEPQPTRARRHASVSNLDRKAAPSQRRYSLSDHLGDHPAANDVAEKKLDLAH